MIACSTSYDRYWEGRKAFASLIASTRNLARQVWLNVAAPPQSESPVGTKGKTPTFKHTLSELRRKKAEAARLALAFVVATKHYLREEDGLGWDDFDGLIPNSLAFYDTEGYGTLKKNTSYLGTQSESPVNGYDNNKSDCSTPGASKLDPTRRVRPKRSKTRMSSQTATTPLLTRSLDVRANLSMPLPLVSVNQFICYCQLIYSQDCI